MVIQCELCSVDAQTADELIRHFSSHFAPGPCRLCNKQLILIDGECHVLQLHNQGHCKHSHLCDPSVPDDVANFGVTKTEIVFDDEPCAMPNESSEHRGSDAENYHAIETVEFQPFELIECHEIKIELENKHDIASEIMTISSDSCSKQLPALRGKVRAIPEAQIQENRNETLNEPSGKRYHCNICGKHYSRKNNLNQHRKIHTEIIDEYKCSICSRNLHTESRLLSHMRAVHGHVATNITSKAAIDQIPPEQLWTDALGDKHLRDFSCEYCGKYFKCSSSLRSHLKKIHLTTKPNVSLTEEECKQYPPDQILIRSNGERILRNFQCNICNKYFLNKSVLRKHKDTHEEIASTIITRDDMSKLPPNQSAVSSTGVVYERKQKCSECNKYYLTKQQLQVHMRNHNRASAARVLTEEECKNLPANRIASRNGQKLLREFKCELCDRYLLSKQILKDHVKDMHEQKKKRSETPQILTEVESKQYPPGQVFLSSSGVRYFRKYQCDICKRYILTRHAVVTHMWRAHIRKKEANQEKKYPCDICGKESRNERALKNHKWFHLQKNRFMCTYCGKGFSNKPALEEHNNVHMGLKPFKCGECDKSFSRRQLLSVHQRVHTGEKPFKCHVAGCDRAYAHGSDLNRHLYGAHRIYKRKYECHICPRIFHEKKLLTKHLLSHD